MFWLSPPKNRGNKNVALCMMVLLVFGFEFVALVLFLVTVLFGIFYTETVCDSIR